MARGDWPAGQQRCTVILPAPIVGCIDLIQDRRCFDSRQATLRYLIETHPAIAEIVAELVHSAQQYPGTPGHTAES